MGNHSTHIVHRRAGSPGTSPRLRGAAVGDDDWLAAAMQEQVPKERPTGGIGRREFGPARKATVAGSAASRCRAANPTATGVAGRVSESSGVRGRRAARIPRSDPSATIRSRWRRVGRGILTGDARHRGVGLQSAAPTCGVRHGAAAIQVFFFDSSRNGLRHWCSMKTKCAGSAQGGVRRDIAHAPRWRSMTMSRASDAAITRGGE
jgi:hypothetical protein